MTHHSTKNKNSEHKETAIYVRNLTKNFYLGKNEIRALTNINLTIHTADYLVVFGPSGCGKTTLLNIMAGADEPTRGRVVVGHKNIFKLDEDGRGIFRSMHMGIVYQTPYWIKSLNVLENVALPLIIRGINEKLAMKRAAGLLSELGIEKFSQQTPFQLSGGEQQKIGIARALISDPHIIIADEPTGNLDSVSADEIMELFHSLNTKMEKTIILVTHNQVYWNAGTKRIEMKDGCIIKITRIESWINGF